MKVLISTPIRFQMTPDGRIWARQEADGYAFWTRYLAAFDHVTLLARVRPVAAPTPGWVRADGEGVTNAAIPDYVGPFQLARKWFPVRRAVRSATRDADAIILRLPCNIGALVWWWSAVKGRPYGVEVLGDPEASLSAGAIEGHLLSVWRLVLPFFLRKICLGATAAAYVTRYALQRRYPPHSSTFATSYSDVMTTHYSSTKLKRSLITDASRAYSHDQIRYSVINVGSMELLPKAQDVLIRACALCLQRGLDLRLTLVGDGKMRPGLELLAAELGVTDRVTFTGQLANEQQIIETLDKADLFALPSRTEGLPRAMIEAMARGMPCIGTNVGGIPELISPDCLVAPNDAPALADKIYEVLTDPARMARMSKENLERVADYTEEVLRCRRQTFYSHVASETAKWNSHRLDGANSGRNLFRNAIDYQIRLSNRLEALLPERFRIDGNQDFICEFVTPYLTARAVVYDIGGGKQPIVSALRKAELGIYVVGVDIDEAELRSAPCGTYDQTVCCDITQYKGNGDADVVICQALLEHVTDTGAALQSIESILKPGGVALLFAPSANAAYARLSVLIPENLKRRLLFSVFPATVKAQGFRAYYDRCTPRELKQAAETLGLVTETLKLYYYSNYFTFFAPIYALWRAWTLAFYAFDRERAAETFSLALRKPAADSRQPVTREKAHTKAHVSSADSERPDLRPLTIFGVNSLFALNQLLGHTLVRLSERGCRLAAVSPDAEEGFIHRAACPGIVLKSIDMRREIAVFHDLLALCRLVFLFRRLRPSVVNLSTPKMGLVGGIAALLAGAPRRIYFLRGLRYETAKGWKRRLLMICERIACACAHEVICVSPSVRRCVIDAGLVPESKTVMLGAKASDGICFKHFQASAGAISRHSLGLSENSFVIGYVGRLTRDKGVQELVHAVKKLETDGRDVRLLVVGAPEIGDPVDEECTRLLSTSALIHATGYVDDPGPYYPVMDLLALPSYREGLGNVLLEAAAAGRPSVATRVTGIVDAVEDGVTGVLVPARDIAALANAIGGLIDDPAKRQAMSAAGPEFVKTHFNADDMADALAAFMLV